MGHARARRKGEIFALQDSWKGGILLLTTFITRFTQVYFEFAARRRVLAFIPQSALLQNLNHKSQRVCLAKAWKKLRERHKKTEV